jgi:RluA family pseudouridine synthase
MRRFVNGIIISDLISKIEEVLTLKKPLKKIPYRSIYMMELPNFSLNEVEIQKLRRHLKTPDGTDISGLGNSSISSAVRIVAPYDFIYKFALKVDEIGVHVDEMLHQRFPFRSIKAWGEKVKSGDILLNDGTVPPGHKLVQNDVVTHRNIGVIEPSAPDDIRVIYDCDEYIIIDKPAPMPMHSGGRYHRNTVEYILNELGYSGLKLVHRLDSVTSGLVILAKSKDVAKQFSTLFEQKKMLKTYEAIVRGNPSQNEMVIQKGIKRLKGYIFTCSDDLESKSAITRFRVIYQGDGWAHVSCDPVTGRTHQIRLHLAEWGHPIWDDDIYNGALENQNLSNHLQKRAISLVSIGLCFEQDQSR